MTILLLFNLIGEPDSDPDPRFNRGRFPNGGWMESLLSSREMDAFPLVMPLAVTSGDSLPDATLL